MGCRSAEQRCRLVTSRFELQDAWSRMSPGGSNPSLTVLQRIYLTAMIVSNQLTNVFQIKCGNSQGTGFVLIEKDIEILLTARHVVEAYGTSNIEFRRFGKWNALNVEPIENPNVRCDAIAMQVISPSIFRGLKMQRAPGLLIGQEIYFLGFPIGLHTDAETHNDDYPIPLAKRGICAGIFGEGPDQVLYLDAMNTHGFSGGPLLCSTGTGELGVFGIISGHRNRTVKAPVMPSGQLAHINENVGITTAYLLASALEGLPSKVIGSSESLWSKFHRLYSEPERDR